MKIIATLLFITACQSSESLTPSEWCGDFVSVFCTQIDRCIDGGARPDCQQAVEAELGCSGATEFDVCGDFQFNSANANSCNEAISLMNCERFTAYVNGDESAVPISCRSTCQ